VSILTTLEKLASHVAAETPTVKHALSSKYMVGKAALYFQNHFKNWSKFIRMFSFKTTPGSFDETMLFTLAVSASRRSSLILLVVELIKEQRGCNSSLSRKQFDAGKRAPKDLMRDLLNSKNRWLDSL